MGTTSDKLTYLNTTKQKLKDSINALGGDITSETTFRAYAEELDNIYDNLPKTTGEGSNLSLSPTLKGKLNIEAYKGDTQQDSTTGKNKFISLVASGTTPTGLSYNVHQDGTFEVSGTISTNNATAIVISQQIDYTNYLDQNMTLSCGYATTNNVGAITSVFYDSSYSQVGSNRFNIDSGRTDATRNLTTAEFPTLKYIRWSFYIPNNMSGTIINIKGKMQLEEGSSATMFEAYTGGQASPNPTYPQDINVVTGTQEVVVQNKNLISGVEFGKYSDETGDKIDDNSVYRNTEFISIKPSTTYTFSINGITQGINKFYYDKNKNYIGKASDVNATFTTPNNAYYLNAFRGTSAGNTGWQLEEGSTATPYTPHQEQTKTLHLGDIELAKIGTYQDRIYKNNDKWYIEKNIGKTIVSNANIFGINATFDNTVRFACLNEFTNMSTLLGLCNRLQVKSMWSTDEEGIYFSTNLQNTIIRMNKSIVGTTKETIGEWLSNNEMLTYSVMATPTYEEITNETLQNELNELEKMMSYNGQTNISVSGNLPMILDVSALKGE